MIEQLVAPTEQHIAELAANMRAEDVEEVAAFGETPLSAVQAAMQVSRDAYAWTIDGKVAAMFGVASFQIMNHVGHPWLLSTPELVRSPWRFLYGSRLFVREWAQQWPVLVNYVDARYTVAVDWIKFMGFTVYDAEPWGPLQAPMRKFEMVRG